MHRPDGHHADAHRPDLHDACGTGKGGGERGGMGDVPQGSCLNTNSVALKCSPAGMGPLTLAQRWSSQGTVGTRSAACALIRAGFDLYSSPPQGLQQLGCAGVMPSTDLEQISAQCQPCVYPPLTGSSAHASVPNAPSALGTRLSRPLAPHVLRTVRLAWSLKGQSVPGGGSNGAQPHSGGQKHLGRGLWGQERSRGGAAGATRPAGTSVGTCPCARHCRKEDVEEEAGLWLLPVCPAEPLMAKACGQTSGSGGKHPDHPQGLRVPALPWPPQSATASTATAGHTALCEGTEMQAGQWAAVQLQQELPTGTSAHGCLSQAWQGGCTQALAARGTGGTGGGCSNP